MKAVFFVQHLICNLKEEVCSPHTVHSELLLHKFLSSDCCEKPSIWFSEQVCLPSKAESFVLHYNGNFAVIRHQRALYSWRVPESGGQYGKGERCASKFAFLF